MDRAQTSTKTPAKTPDAWRIEHAQLTQKISTYEVRIQDLQAQVDWFKRQLFGQTSEKRPIETNPHQLSLSEVLGETSEPPPPEEKVSVTYQRGKARKDRGDALNEQGLRFDDSVPVESIELPSEPIDLGLKSVSKTFKPRSIGSNASCLGRLLKSAQSRLIRTN